MTINYKKIISFLVVFAVALVTGFTIGKMYLDSNTMPEGSTKTYEEIVASDEEILALYNRSLTENVSSFNGIELWQIAHYKLSELSYFKKVMTGNVNSTGQNLILKAVKEKKDKTLTYTKLSPSATVPFIGIKTPEVCSKFTYNYDTQNTNIVYGKFDVSGPSSNDLAATFPTTGGQNYSKDAYISEFKALPDQGILPYGISNKVVPESAVSVLTENEDGTFTFTISLSGHDAIKDPAAYYTEEIFFSCGYKSPSIGWKEVKLTVTVDENFMFKSIKYHEVYSLDSPSIPILATITDEFEDAFFFEEV